MSGNQENHFARVTIPFTSILNSVLSSSNLLSFLFNPAGFLTRDPNSDIEVAPSVARNVLIDFAHCFSPSPPSHQFCLGLILLYPNLYFQSSAEVSARPVKKPHMQKSPL